LAWEGCYHEGQPFQATLISRRLFETAHFILWFRAESLDGERYHEEVSLIGISETGDLVMASANTNIPYLQLFDELPPSSVSTRGSNTTRLSHGDATRTDAFRETISLSLTETDELKYSFAWAMPGEALKDRSAAVMVRHDVVVPPNAPIR